MRTQASLHPLVRLRSERFERRLDVIQHRKPGEQREALEDDGDVGNRTIHRLAVPQHFAGGGFGKPSEDAQQRRFSRSGRAEQRENFAGVNGKIGGRDDLDARFAGFAVHLLDLLGFDDGFWHVRSNDLVRTR